MTSSSDTEAAPGWSESVRSSVGRAIIPSLLDTGSDVSSGSATVTTESPQQRPGLARQDVRIGVVGAKFNGAITLRLLEGLLGGLQASSVDPAAVTVAWVPGAVEIPVVAAAMARSGRFDTVVCLGAVIRGDTPHFEYVAGPCAAMLAQIAVETLVPVVFGVLTTETVRQAVLRSVPGPVNKGWEAGETALATAEVLRRLGDES